MHHPRNCGVATAWVGARDLRKPIFRWTASGAGGLFLAQLGCCPLLMSWAATGFPTIAQYGWGAIIFAGVGAACGFMIAASALMVSWRYFKPLTKQPATSSEKGQEEPALDDISFRLAEAERIIDQNKADLGQLRTRVEMLTKSLCARDAESIIKEADKIIMPISERLLKEPYPDEAAWAVDYAVWEGAMKQIDTVWLQWQPHETPFLNIRQTDLERAPAPPPQNPVQSYVNVTRYKKMCLAQQRYADVRDGIFQYFSHKRTGF